MSPVTVTILIPTYRRGDDLRRCLRAVARQHAPADQVVVVRRRDDKQSAEVLEEAASLKLPLAVVLVDQPGVVHAMQQGLAAATGTVLAFLDDDAEPHEDWLKRIKQHFADGGDDLAGVGGLDLIEGQMPSPTGPWPEVGKVRWYGKTIGNHHRGGGPAREVDTLKGCNMAVRRELVEQIGFDDRLRGEGAQVAWELALLLPLRRQGWRLIYDPAIRVNHHIAIRHDADQRGTPAMAARTNAVHNETLTVLQHLTPLGRVAFRLWGLGIGTRAHLGVAQAIRFMPKSLFRLTGRRAVVREFLAAARGRATAFLAFRSADRRRRTPVHLPH